METETVKGTVSSNVDDLRDLRELLLDRRPVAVRVQGSCMAPTLNDGQMILALHSREPRPGDVALLDAGGTLEVHRLLDRVRACGRTWYVHAGDAPGSRPGIADGKDVLGVVVAPPGGAVPVRARLLGFALRARALLDLLLR